MSGNFELFHGIWFPFAAAFLCYLVGRVDKKLRDRLLQLAVIIEFVLLLVAAAGYLENGEMEFLLEGFCMRGLHLKMDGFRMLYGCIAAFMWMMTGIFSREYFKHYRNRNRFGFFFLLTLGATVGVFLSADFYTLFLFFEIMSLTSYVWVVHDESREAMKAGEIYLAISVIGGLVILMGLFLLYYVAGTLEIEELYSAIEAVKGEKQILIYVAGGCMLFGFGAKAGMFPLHIWLPKAHPVAPAPASALLSGILTKSGVFGILAVSAEMFRDDPRWGNLLLFLGVITMLGGALLAVFSLDLKRTLACSSMSQIGFILVGIGMMELLGREGALAARGTILHMVNHSLIKLVLFIVAGVVYMNIHALNLNDIRGFGRKKPLLKVMFLMGALSIAGIPGWSGYISKTMLHESMVEYMKELALRGQPVFWYRISEWAFLLAGGMTIAYMTKIFLAVFVDKHPENQQVFDETSNYMNGESLFALSVPAVILTAMGFLPYLTMNRMADLAQGFLHVEAGMEGIRYYTAENLKGAGISLIIGILIYFGFIRKVLMKKTEQGYEYLNVWPGWMDVEDLIYRPVFQKALVVLVAGVCKMIDQMYLSRLVLKGLLNLSVCLSRICDRILDSILVLLRRTTHRSRTEQHVYLIGSRASRVLGTVLDNIAAVMGRVFRKKRDPEQSFVIKFAEWEEIMHRTNRLISVSLSFGLMLAAIGLGLTLIYLLWW